MQPEQEINNFLKQSFDIEFSPTVSKDALLAALSHRIRQLMEGNIDYLFSTLYRMDIPEEKIKTALYSNQGDFASNIANLVYQRQYEKMEMRRKHRSTSPESDDLAW